MPTKEQIKKYLAARIWRWMESGEPEVSLEYMLPETNGDINLLKEILSEWQNKGQIEWLLPLNVGEPDKPIVRFRCYPNSNVIWKKY